MGQRLRDREREFVPTFKYGTVKSKKPLVSIGQCCSWVVNSRVVICSHKESAVQETCQTFQKEGFEVSGIKADVTVKASQVHKI